MCGRFKLSSSPTTLFQKLGIELPEELANPDRFNIAPGQPVLCIVADPIPRFEFMEWGFIPTWAKPETNPKAIINARGESIAEKPYFRGAFRSSRCVIIADGFYEWDKRGREKEPYHLSMKDGRTFAMAGIWSTYDAIGDGSAQLRCAVITTDANNVVGEIHNRMPVILHEDEILTWLHYDTPVSELQAMLQPFPAGAMKSVQIDRTLNDPANDGPDIIKPAHGRASDGRVSAKQPPHEQPLGLFDGFP